MRIAIDYDGTMTLDPLFWDKFIELVKYNGDDICIVTLRSENAKIDALVPVIYTGGKAKRDFCEERGMKFDIWIDDNPYYILNDARQA